MLSDQELFDKVVNHLRVQGCKALENEHCKYRTASGLKCAAGCLIPDDMYKPSMEGMNIIGVIQNNPNLEDVISNPGLISRLQFIHDWIEVMSWEESFKGVAIQFGLVYTPTAN